MTRTTGTPTWLDVCSNDAERSKQFYAELFGWTFVDQGEDLGHYTFIESEGDVIGGFMDVTGQPGPDGKPMAAEWGVVLAVEDVAARHARALAAGATDYMGPHPVRDFGALAWVYDPTGAIVGLWQAGTMDGYTFSGRPGTPVWFELMSTDFDASVDFYRDVFDFDIAYLGAPDGGQNGIRYATNFAGDAASAGICEAKQWLGEGATSYWRIYLGAEDTNAAVERVRELGGELLDGPVDSEFGRVATVADCCGATFQLNQPLAQLRAGT